MMPPRLLLATLFALAGTAGAQTYPPDFGPNPTLPAPVKALLPTLNIAPADPWPKGTAPQAAPCISRVSESPLRMRGKFMVSFRPNCIRCESYGHPAGVRSKVGIRGRPPCAGVSAFLTLRLF